MNPTFKLDILQVPSIQYLKSWLWAPKFAFQTSGCKQICQTTALRKASPGHRTGFQIRLQKWTQPQALESRICLTATVSSEWLTLKISKAGNVLNPSLKPYDFLWASITHLFAQHLAYFSSYAEVPEVLSLLASSEAKQGNITRMARLCRGARGKVASPSSWFMALQLTMSGWKTSPSSVSSKSNPADAHQGDLKFNPK